MKLFKFLIFVCFLSFFVSCSSGGGEAVPVLGCMDDCAINYNADASQADPNDPCLFSILGTYEISEWLVNGESIFLPSENVTNPMISGYIAFDVLSNANTGVYEYEYLFSDGTINTGSGTFENNQTQLLFDPGTSEQVLWATTKINCLEFDGNATSDGILSEIELTYFSENSKLKENPNAINTNFSDILKR